MMSFVSLTQHLLRTSTQRVLTTLSRFFIARRRISTVSILLKQGLTNLSTHLLWDMVMMLRSMSTGIRCWYRNSLIDAAKERLVFDLLVSWIGCLLTRTKKKVGRFPSLWKTLRMLILMAFWAARSAQWRWVINCIIAARPWSFFDFVNEM